LDSARNVEGGLQRCKLVVGEPDSALAMTATSSILSVRALEAERQRKARIVHQGRELDVSLSCSLRRSSARARRETTIASRFSNRLLETVEIGATSRTRPPDVALNLDTFKQSVESARRLSSPRRRPRRRSAQAAMTKTHVQSSRPWWDDARLLRLTLGLQGATDQDRTTVAVIAKALSGLADNELASLQARLDVRAESQNLGFSAAPGRGRRFCPSCDSCCRRCGTGSRRGRPPRQGHRKALANARYRSSPPTWWRSVARGQ